MRNDGILFTLLLCCGWPLIVHAGILYFSRTISQRDWTNIRWSEIRFPWSKHQ